MNPVAFTLFSIQIRWYGILISTGMIIGILLAKKSCDVKKISYDTLIDIILIALPLAIIGARLYYVLFNLDYYSQNMGEILNIRQGGLAIHGGLIFAIGSAYLYCRKKQISFLKYADAAAPSIIIAQALGRWGNFFNQEAHGGPVTKEFISHFPAFIQNGMYIEGTYYHPTFLYESIWNVLVFICLTYVLRKSKKDGTTIFTYVGLYSIGRFFIEGLRTDSLMIGPLRIAQIVSLLGVAIWIVFLYFVYIKEKTILPHKQ